MTAVLLSSAAVLLAVLGGRVLTAAGIAVRAPGAAVLLWQSLTIAVLGSVLLALVVMILPASPAILAETAAWLGTCLGLLEAQYPAPLGDAGSLVALALLVLVVARGAAGVLGEAMAAGRARTRAREHLAVLVRGAEPDWPLVVDDPRPTAYCIPGRRSAIVMTSGAISSLNDAERGAVLAHERAHLRSRHHWVITWASGLHRAFPFVPAFRAAAEALPLVIEMHADDVAARVAGRRALATALVRMAEGPTPGATLAISGSGALVRVRRLLTEPCRLSRTAITGVVALIVTMLVAPALIMLAPAMESALRDDCAPFEHPCDVPGRSDVSLN